MFNPNKGLWGLESNKVGVSTTEPTPRLYLHQTFHRIQILSPYSNYEGGKKINIALSPLMKPRENQKYNQIQPHPTLLSNLTVVLRATKIYIVSLIRPHGNSLE